MTKLEAKELFGSTQAVCNALGVKPHTYYRYPDELPQAKTDQLHGAYLRLVEKRDALAVHLIGGRNE